MTTITVSLNSKPSPPPTILITEDVSSAARILQKLDLPILDDSTGVFATAHPDHEDGEEEEKASHGKAHPVH